MFKESVFFLKNKHNVYFTYNHFSRHRNAWNKFDFFIFIFAFFLWKNRLNYSLIYWRNKINITASVFVVLNMFTIFFFLRGFRRLYFSQFKFGLSNNLCSNATYLCPHNRYLQISKEKNKRKYLFFLSPTLKNLNVQHNN